VEPNDELAKQVHKLTTGTTRLILQLLKPNLAAIKKIKKAVIDKAKADWKAEQAAAGLELIHATKLRPVEGKSAFVSTKPTRVRARPSW